MPQPEIKFECKHCGHPLESNYIGPCPNCGRKGRNITVELYEKISISDSIKEANSQKSKIKSIAFAFLVLIPIIIFLNQIISSVKLDILTLLSIIILISVGGISSGLFFYFIIKIATRGSKEVNKFKKRILNSYNKILESSVLNPKIAK